MKQKPLKTKEKTEILALMNKQMNRRIQKRASTEDFTMQKKELVIGKTGHLKSGSQSSKKKN